RFLFCPRCGTNTGEPVCPSCGIKTTTYSRMDFDLKGKLEQIRTKMVFDIFLSRFRVKKLSI
ncbi:MAG: hypothetical protein ABSA06_11110, partial [Geobacteraceae bacterium]